MTLLKNNHPLTIPRKAYLPKIKPQPKPCTHCTPFSPKKIKNKKSNAAVENLIWVLLNQEFNKNAKWKIDQLFSVPRKFVIDLRHKELLLTILKLEGNFRILMRMNHSLKWPIKKNNNHDP